MREIPHEVLSEHFQEHLEGCRLVAALFTTFSFEPGFFEQEILPVFLDASLSHVPTIRLVQLEDAVRSVPEGIAVYYDANGLDTGDAGSAHLDIRRIPVRHKTGIFHPKIALVLVEAAENDKEGRRPRSLLVANMSANLTRYGWWERVECCHVEKIHAGDRTRIKNDLDAFLKRLRENTAATGDHRALDAVRKFLKDVDQRQHKSDRGRVHTHFYAGREPLVDFLDRILGRDIRGCSLEIISPFFDDRETCGPLEDLLERFEPRDVQIYLPRTTGGLATVRRELYESVAAHPNVRWSRLAAGKDGWLRRGKAEDAGPRQVHAKVYRFFTKRPRREVTFVGSVNLTTAAHSGRGNLEAGFLVDTVPDGVPAFWMEPEGRTPSAFEHQGDDAEIAASGGTRLTLRYHWDLGTAEVLWDHYAESPMLRVTATDKVIGTFERLPSREWVAVPADMAGTVRQELPRTSLFEVHGESEAPGLLLVQEEGMSHKPSILLHLTATDILRYWSLLTAEQREAFIDSHATSVVPTDQGGDLVALALPPSKEDTLFDRFAGFFHAFGCMERAVRAAIDEHREREADYRLFGCKYDSLGSLLDRIANDSMMDEVDRYVLMLCARQVHDKIAVGYPDFWRSRKADAVSLKKQLDGLDAVRETLIARQGVGFKDFVAWFEPRFLKPARLKEPVDD